MSGTEEELRAAANWAVTRGSLLFHLDLATSIARDHVSESDASDDVDAWAADVGPNGYEVCFLGEKADRELLAVTFSADGAPLLERRQGTPSQRQRKLAAAVRTTEAAAGTTAASIIVVPPERGAAADQPMISYAIRRAERPGDVVIGVHRRYRLSGNGRRVLATEPLSAASLVVPGTDGSPPADLTVTHLNGEVPSEVHVYLSLKHGIPISVITAVNEEHWIVDGETISLL